MRLLLLVVAGFLVACSEAEDQPDGCETSADCDDGNACTDDSCGASGSCANTPKVVDDQIECTTDACDPATGAVTHTPVDTMCEKDGATCTVAVCNPTSGCSETPTQAMCDDGATCSTETCDPSAAGADATTGCKVTLNDSACGDSFSCTTNTCTPSAVAADATTGCLVVPVNSACDDSVSCTADSCNPSAAGADAAGCVNQTMDNLCEVDGKSCTVATCSATTGCSETPMNSLCNDNATCSTDTCSPTGPGATGCVYALNNAMCADSAECSTDACSPGTAGADATTGCYYTANEAACSSDATCSTGFDCVCNDGFSGNGLTCTGITCDPLDDPTDGSVAVTNGGNYPSTATYSCSAGLAPFPITTRTCNPDGTWTDGAPTCDPTFMVVRVGDGTGALSPASTAVFLEERTRTGTLVRTLALPTAASGSNAPFTLGGSATTEGGLSLAANEQFVTLAGYAVAPGVATVNGTSNLTGDSPPTNRVVARVSTNGTVDTSTRMLDAFSTSSVRGACTVDGTAFWVTGNSGSGSTGGVHYVALGSAGTTTRVSGTQNNLRHAHVFGSQLYVSSGAGTTTRGVLAVGNGTPTTTGQTATQVAAFASTLSPESFAVLDVDPNVNGLDTIYVAVDQGALAGTVNLQKWVNNGSAWSQVTAFAPTVTGTTLPNALGLATWVHEDDGVYLVVTTSESPSRLLLILDDGSTDTPAATVLATATANTAFRGVARSPTQ